MTSHGMTKLSKCPMKKLNGKTKSSYICTPLPPLCIIKAKLGASDGGSVCLEGVIDRSMGRTQRQVMTMGSSKCAQRTTGKEMCSGEEEGIGFRLREQ
ncbi:uncharacterized protein VTP21DRAFT_4508 [Calcarisporiella thermophila]|uniref:uncharacterized protein n=1 Tax=Calcarisporiella thermophila TaxID=911321 RepID=UPI0037434496